MTSPAPTSQNVSIHTQAWLMLMCGLVYFYAFQLNMHWFSDWLEFSPGVNWIFIPSGLRLLFVLVLVGTGATGIVLGSIAINYLLGDPEAHLFNMVTAIISGTAPYLARYLSITWLRLDAHLANLSGNTLFKVSVLFAIINALTHQVWFYLTGRTENLIGSFTAMAVGDWFGTVLVLATAGLGIKLFKLHRSSVL